MAFSNQTDPVISFHFQRYKQYKEQARQESNWSEVMQIQLHSQGLQQAW
jgi:hypothetical protein